MFEEVDERRKRFDRFSPPDQALIRRLDSYFEPFFIWGSNAIEGNTLSLGETIVVVREGRLPGGKREEEYLEVKGQQDAYKYLKQSVVSRYQLSEKLIREFHQLLTARLDEEKYGPGRYKNRENQVRLADGTVFPYTSLVDTPAAMRALVEWYEGAGAALHPIERAAWLHYKFILIHPFNDGNGRTARILTNLALMQAGYVMTIFRAEERRPVYLGALRAVDESVPRDHLAPENPALNLFPFVSYLEQELLWSYDRAIDIAEGRLAVDSEDLLRDLSRLEERALLASGVAPDEKTRLEEMAKSVDRLADTAAQFLRSLAARAQLQLRALELQVSMTDGYAVDLLTPTQPRDSSAGCRRTALMLRDAPPKGKVASITLSLASRRDELSGLTVNLPGASCEFVIYAEPHGLRLASIVLGPWLQSSQRWYDDDTGDWHARIELPLDPAAWRQSAIEQFLVAETHRFLALVRGAIGTTV